MTATRAPEPNVSGDRFRELSLDEGWALLEERSQHYLQIGAREFVRRWDAGETENPDRPEIIRVAMLLSFVR
ncbi:MAG: hypothetical protein ACR2PL_12665 [Dehalococcoidia bacterium]